MSNATLTKQTTATADKVSTVQWTVANARKAGGFPDLDALIAELAADKAAVDREAGQVMYRAALGFHNVVNVTESLGQGDYVVRIGFSKAYGTLLKRLARAAVVHGVQQGSDTWRFLCSKGGDAKVGKVLDRPKGRDVTAELRTMAAEFKGGTYTASARQALPASDPAKGTENETESDKASGTQPAPGKPTTEPLIPSFDQAVAAIAMYLKNADKDTFSRMEDRITEVVAHAISERAKVTETVPGEVVATPATVAKPRKRA